VSGLRMRLDGVIAYLIRIYKVLDYVWITLKL
jgi:hypothetical protein